MSNLTKRLVRCALTVANPFPGKLQDVITAKPPETVRGNATRFEFGFFTRLGEIYDLEEIESVTLKIQPSQVVSGALADQTLAAADLDLTLDAGSWADGTKAHAAFEFTNAEMNLTMRAERKTFWMVVTALLADGTKVTLSGGNLLIHSGNDEAGDPPPQNAGTAITLEQADARYIQESEVTEPGLDLLAAVTTREQRILLDVTKSARSAQRRSRQNQILEDEEDQGDSNAQFVELAEPWTGDPGIAGPEYLLPSAEASQHPLIISNRTSGNIAFFLQDGVTGVISLTPEQRAIFWAVSGVWKYATLPAESGVLARLADITGTNSGVNTGDQDLSGLVPNTRTVNGQQLNGNVTITTITGNAGTATALQNARTIDGQSFNGTANITVIAPGTVAATAKTTPADADLIPIVDSAASNVLKKLTFGNLWVWIKAKLDSGLTIAGSWAFSSTTRPTSSGTGDPATNSLITRNDLLLHHSMQPFSWLNGNQATANGGSIIAARGGCQLFTSTTANSSALTAVQLSYLGYNSTSQFSRRMVLVLPFTVRTLPTGRRIVVQFGRNTGSAVGILATKGFGFRQDVSTITPFVHNGSTLTEGTTFARGTYDRIIMDFQPGVAVYIYGRADGSNTLLATLSTGLPSGAAAGEPQIELALYDQAGAGGANEWAYFGQPGVAVF